MFFLSHFVFSSMPSKGTARDDWFFKQMATTLLSGSTGYGTSREWKDWTQKVKMEGGSWRKGISSCRILFQEGRVGL